MYCRLALNLENTNGSFVSLQDIHKACVKVIHTNIRRLFDVESMCSRVTKGDKGIMFENLSPRTVTSQDKFVRLPSMCKVAETARLF